MYIVIGVIKPNSPNPMSQFGYTGIWFPPEAVPDDSGGYRISKNYTFASYNIALSSCSILNSNRINTTGFDMSEDDFYGYVVWNTSEPLADLIPINKLGKEIFGSPKATKYFSQPLCACIKSSELYNNSIDMYSISSSDIETVAIKYDYRLQRELRFS